MAPKKPKTTQKQKQTQIVNIKIGDTKKRKSAKGKAKAKGKRIVRKDEIPSFLPAMRNDGWLPPQNITRSGQIFPPYQPISQPSLLSPQPRIEFPPELERRILALEQTGSAGLNLIQPNVFNPAQTFAAAPSAEQTFAALGAPEEIMEPKVASPEPEPIEVPEVPESSKRDSLMLPSPPPSPEFAPVSELGPITIGLTNDKEIQNYIRNKFEELNLNNDQRQQLIRTALVENESPLLKKNKVTLSQVKGVDLRTLYEMVNQLGLGLPVEI